MVKESKEKLQKEGDEISNLSIEESEVLINKSAEELSKNDKDSTGKRIARKIGRGLVMGVKKVVWYSKKKIQIRKWKGSILRRMIKAQLKKLCFEKKLSIMKEVEKEDEKTGEIYYEELECTKKELVVRLKNRLKLESVISFAKRNHISISDIMADIEKTKAEWKARVRRDKIKTEGNKTLLEVWNVIRDFKPLRQYNKEFHYQDTLAQFLKSKFPSTKIEVRRGSTRPDIVVRNVAIEIKGPTSHKDLMSIADKSMRYKQYFPHLICVLFNVNVSKQFYNDWLKGIENIYLDVEIIKL